MRLHKESEFNDFRETVYGKNPKKHQQRGTEAEKPASSMRRKSQRGRK